MLRSILLTLAMGLSGCATTGSGQTARDPITQAVSQPLRDISLIRERLPEPLVRAAAEPYRVPAGCEDVRTELAELDGVLGPDVDQAINRPSMSQYALSEAIRSVVGLPYRGAVRELTGAARRDRALASAVLSATARRGFLKGLLVRCGAAPPGPAAG